MIYNISHSVIYHPLNPDAHHSPYTLLIHNTTITIYHITSNLLSIAYYTTAHIT